jgi:hypothetical protein
MNFLLRRAYAMTELPQGEHATFSFLDLITLGLVLDAIPDFTHGKVLGGVVCLWLAYVNHAIGVRWKISRYLVPLAALTLFVYAFLWCVDIKDTEMKYFASGLIGALILIAAVAAYSWIGNRPEPPASKADTNPPIAPPSAPSTSLEQNDSHVANQSPVPSKKTRTKKPRATQSATKAPAQAPDANCDYTAVMSDNIFRNGAMPPPNVGSHTLMDNNLVQSGDWNPTADITVEGKDSTVRHNTLEGFNRETIHSTKDADRAVIEDNLLRHDNGGSTQDNAGNGADMEKIRKAQTSTIYVPPCPNMGQPFPD